MWAIMCAKACELVVVRLRAEWTSVLRKEA